MPVRDEHLMELARVLRAQFPSSLKQIILFGSHARGEASADSDYDCLLLFDRVTATVREELDRLTGDYLVQRGLVLSCIPLTEGELERLAFEPFVINARHEGVVL